VQSTLVKLGTDVVTRLCQHVVQVEGFPNDDGSVSLSALCDGKGNFSSDLLSVDSLETLKVSFPAWDGKLDWLDDAYTKFKGSDPRILKANLSGLSPQSRREKLPAPEGAVTAPSSKVSCGIDLLLKQGKRMQEATDSLARQSIAHDSSGEDTGDEQQSPLKPKAMFINSPIVEGKRSRKRVTRFTATHATSCPRKKDRSKSSATKPLSGKRPAPPDSEELTPRRVKLATKLQIAGSERDRVKAEAKRLQNELVTVKESVKTLKEQLRTVDSASVLRIEVEKLKLLLSSVREVALCYAQDEDKMSKALTRMGKKFSVDF
jgi:hypothetical protein